MGISAALAAFRAALGADAVADPAGVNHATFTEPTSAAAVLRPASRDAVAACLRIASEHRVPLHPVSTGRNWGYGSALPAHDGAAVLLLASLAGIDYDDATGRVRVEPGVTFAALANLLAARGSRFQAPRTGSGMHTSIVGNVMERGIGKGLYEDLSAQVTGCVALLADGTVLATDHERPGPIATGLLLQSNLAVVVELTLQLLPTPRLCQVASFSLEDAAAVAAACTRLDDALLAGRPRIQLAFLNDYRVATQLAQFPFDAADPGAAVPDAWMAAWRAALPCARWNGVLTLWDDDEALLSVRRAALDEAGLSLDWQAPAPGHESLDDEGLRCAYWRKRFPMPADPDPDRDRCGVIWSAPTLPATLAGALLPEIEALMLALGVEPALGLRWRAPGVLRLLAGIFTDRDHPGADARALACHQALSQLLAARGLLHYRHGLLDAPPATDPGTAQLIAALKDRFDPYRILAPRRYALP